MIKRYYEVNILGIRESKIIVKIIVLKISFTLKS